MPLGGNGMGTMAVFSADELGAAGSRLTEAARYGEVRIRGADGSDLVVCREEQLRDMHTILNAAAGLATLQEVRHARASLPPDWQHPEWPWLKELDAEDLDTFAE